MREEVGREHWAGEAQHSVHVKKIGQADGLAGIQGAGSCSHTTLSCGWEADRGTMASVLTGES